MPIRGQKLAMTGIMSIILGKAKLVYSKGTASAEENLVHTVTELVALSDRRALQEG